MFRFAHPQSHDNILVQKNLMTKMELFKRRPSLIGVGKYEIRSNVSPDVVGLFFARVMGDETEVVTVENVEQLQALCHEFGFSGFDDEIRAVLSGDSQVRKDLVRVRQRVDRHDVVIEQLLLRVRELERQLREQREAPQLAEVVERRLEEICANRTDVDEVMAIVSKETGDIRKEVEQLKRDVSGRVSTADMKKLSNDVVYLKEKVGWDFEYDSSKPLDGIIAYLTRACGGNVHDRGVVEVTGSSCWDSKHQAKNVVDLGDVRANSYFYSQNEPNQWICCNFKRRFVAPTHYSIRVDDSAYPHSWVLEVSNDGKSWKVVDRRDNNVDLAAKYAIRNFEITAPPLERFQFVRLRQTGTNDSGGNHFVVNALELFGTLSSQ